MCAYALSLSLLSLFHVRVRAQGARSKYWRRFVKGRLNISASRRGKTERRPERLPTLALSAPNRVARRFFFFLPLLAFHISRAASTRGVRRIFGAKCGGGGRFCNKLTVAGNEDCFSLSRTRPRETEIFLEGSGVLGQCRLVFFFREWLERYVREL